MRTLLEQTAYVIRNVKCRILFIVLRTYCRNLVLDVGGGDFFWFARKQGIPFKHWITVETDRTNTFTLTGNAWSFVLADGQSLPFTNDSFDTVLGLHVFEHVFDPYRMFQEMLRVLKPGGHAVILLPQTTPLHHVPNHFQNFMVFWLREAARREEAELVEYSSIGGFWGTIASRMLYFFLQCVRAKGYSYPECERRPLFYLLLPFMIPWAILNVVVGMVFVLGDLGEEATDHLAVLRKRV